MKLISFNKNIKELPVKVVLSVEPLYKELAQYTKDKNHIYHKSSKVIEAYINKFPELRTGIENYEKLEKYEEALKLILEPLFPPLLQSNEIKAMSIPFLYKAFHPTTRLAKIIKNAGPDYELTMSGFNIDTAYIYACSYILAKYYKQPVLKLNRPIFLDIPNELTGQMYHYRMMFNLDNVEITKTDNAPELTQSDIDELLANGEDQDLWKKKFPPNSYIVKGFGIMNLFNATVDVLTSKTRTLFLRTDEKVFSEFQQNIRDLFGNPNLMIGVSNYDTNKKQSISSFFNKSSQSLFMEQEEEMDYRHFFCEGINSCVLDDSEIMAFSDVNAYAKKIHHNTFSKRLKQKGINSILLIPIKLKSHHIQLIEIASTKKNELNILVSAKLDSIIPFIKIATERYFEESENIIESTIQENYTSIHPSVKWRFTEAAINFNSQQTKNVENPILSDIVFDNVYPLYGQSDIVGSSKTRNLAIQEDLELQLSLVIDTFEKVMKIQYLPIYKKIIYRVRACLQSVKKGLNAGDEAGILAFLKIDVYPVFNHVMTLDPQIKKIVEKYIARIDPELKVIYQQRKAYETSVNILNDNLAGFLDRRLNDIKRMV